MSANSGAVDIAAGLDHRDALAGQAAALLQRRREGSRAGSLGDVVRVGEQDAHRRADFGLAHRDDARGAMADDVERRRVGDAAGEAVGDRVGAVGRHRPAGCEGQRIGRRLGGDDADDLGLQPERLARRDHPADPAAEPDRHIDRVEPIDRAQQFERIRRDPAHQGRIERAHQVQTVPRRQRNRRLVGGLEIMPGFDQRRAKRRHRAVLLDAVAVGHDDRRGEPQPGGGKGDALPVIAAGRADDAAYAGLGLLQRIEIDKAAA